MDKEKFPIRSTRPIGHELNIEETSDELHVHNDVHTLVNLQKRAADANVVNGFLSRMQAPEVDVSDVPTGSRFAPWLSDKLEAAKREISSLEDAEKDVAIQKKFAERKAALKEAAEKYGIDL